MRKATVLQNVSLTIAVQNMTYEQNQKSLFDPHSDPRAEKPGRRQQSR